MLERPPTFEEIWRARITNAFLAMATFAVLVVVQWKVLRLNFYAGCGLAPLWNFGAFQLLSRLSTGRSFGLRLDPQARTPEEVGDLVFTVGFLLTLLVGVYATYDTWAYVAPQLP